MVLKVKKKHDKASKTTLCDVHIVILKAPFLYPQKRFDQIVHLTRSSDILSLGNSLLVILITPAPIIIKVGNVSYASICQTPNADTSLLFVSIYLTKLSVWFFLHVYF